MLIDIDGFTHAGGTVANAKRLAERAGFEVRLLGPDRTITAEELAGAAVWIQPGAEGEGLYPYVRTTPRRRVFQKSNASIADLMSREKGTGFLWHFTRGSSRSTATGLPLGRTSPSPRIRPA